MHGLKQNNSGGAILFLPCHPLLQMNHKEGSDWPMSRKQQSWWEKKTKILGADSESEDSSEDVVTKLNKSYPDYWKYEDSQHEATCSCDFCKIYFGRVPHTTPTNEIQGTSSSSTTFETVPEPQSPDAAWMQGSPACTNLFGRISKCLLFELCI